MYLAVMFLNFTEVFEPCMPSHSLVNVGHKLFLHKIKSVQSHADMYSSFTFTSYT